MTEVAQWAEINLLEDLSYLDRYQELVSTKMLVWDEGSRTLGGGNEPVQYMVDGLIEEVDETISPNDRSAPYRRLDVLIGGIETQAPVDHQDVVRHQKEFGDVSWYGANVLKLANIKFSQAVKLGLEAEDIAAKNQPKCDETGFRLMHEEFPFAPYLSDAGLAIKAAERFAAARREMESPNDPQVRARIAPWPTTEREAIGLGIATGRLTISMARLVKAVFDVDYRTILDQNVSKIGYRIEHGTVFSNEGGDDR